MSCPEVSYSDDAASVVSLPTPMNTEFYTWGLYFYNAFAGKTVSDKKL